MTTYEAYDETTGKALHAPFPSYTEAVLWGLGLPAHTRWDIRAVTGA